MFFSVIEFISTNPITVIFIAVEALYIFTVPKESFKNSL